MLLRLDPTSEHQADAGGNVAGSPKTNESYRGTHFHNTMHRCKLVTGHRVHVKRDELVHGDLYSCLMLKLQSCALYQGDPGRTSNEMRVVLFLLRPEGTER